MNRKILWISVTSITLIIIDQLIKLQVYRELKSTESLSVIRGVLNLTYVENTGVAFGMGANSLNLLIIATVLVLVGIISFIILKKEELSTAILTGLSLIIAGGVGNLLDRIFRGFVIDYIDINPLFRFPVFNLADICIVVGSVVIAIKILKGKS